MRKLLVANRSEIAIRVFRAATELGLATVAVFTYEDRFSLHRFKADEAYQIGPPHGGEPVKGYLNIQALIDVAKANGVDAIHPGYGFLIRERRTGPGVRRQRHHFRRPHAQSCCRSSATRPPPKSWRNETGVPTIPGTENALADPAEIRAAAKEIGFPLIIKASFGGGGPGHAHRQ